MADMLATGPMDAAQLRALSHPLRLRMLEVLREGPATASALGRRLGESSGATSYHLRALAKAGVVEEDERQLEAGALVAAASGAPVRIPNSVPSRRLRTASAPSSRRRTRRSRASWSRGTRRRWRRWMRRAVRPAARVAGRAVDRELPHLGHRGRGSRVRRDRARAGPAPAETTGRRGSRAPGGSLHLPDAAPGACSPQAAQLGLAHRPAVFAKIVCNIPL